MLETYRNLKMFQHFRHLKAVQFSDALIAGSYLAT